MTFSFYAVIYGPEWEDIKYFSFFQVACEQLVEIVDNDFRRNFANFRCQLDFYECADGEFKFKCLESYAFDIQSREVRLIHE